MTLQLVLWIVAVVLFGVATFAPGVGAPRFNLLAAGLAFTVAGLIVGAA